MNLKSFSCSLEEVPPTRSIVIDGIRFSGVCLIRLDVGGTPLAMAPGFEDSLVVYNELRASASKSGQYLVFTSASGIADDAGWDRIRVDHLDGAIIWKLDRDDQSIRYDFDPIEYRAAIDALGREIAGARQRGLQLEPANVIPPEA